MSGARLLPFADDVAAFLRPKLCLSASIKLMTLLFSSLCSGTSIVLPAALRFTNALSAVSYLSLNLCGSNFDALVSRIWAARSTMSFDILGLGISPK